MTSFVLDASVAIAGLSGEGRPECDALVARSLAEPVAVPSLWPLEVANILTLKVRRGTLPARDRMLALRSVRDFWLTIDLVDPRSEQFESVIALADAHRLTADDAAYLELAMRLGAPLATLDEALRAAARAEAEPLLPA